MASPMEALTLLARLCFPLYPIIRSDHLCAWQAIDQSSAAFWQPTCQFRVSILKCKKSLATTTETCWGGGVAWDLARDPGPRRFCGRSEEEEHDAGV